MQVLRWVIGSTLFLALLFLSLQNSELVTLKFYHWWSWQAPLIFIVLLSFAIGAAAGLLAGAVRSARLKRQLNRVRRERLRSGPPSTREESAAGQRAEDAARSAGFVPTSGPLNGV
jgi:lipopolysaccharide assembly protein A